MNKVYCENKLNTCLKHFLFSKTSKHPEQIEILTTCKNRMLHFLKLTVIVSGQGTKYYFLMFFAGDQSCIWILYMYMGNSQSVAHNSTLSKLHNFVMNVYQQFHCSFVFFSQHWTNVLNLISTTVTYLTTFWVSILSL